MDRHSRYTRFIPSTDIKSETIIRNFLMIKRSILLVAKEVLTDQGTQFMSSGFKKMLHVEGIGHPVITAYNQLAIV